MHVLDYIKDLTLFYNELTIHPMNKLEFIEGENKKKFCKMSFREDQKIIDYNLGFKVKKCCYVFNKLATKNLKILEELQSDEYTELLFTVELKKNKAKFILYDIYGKIILKRKIKFVSLNLF